MAPMTKLPHGGSARDTVFRTEIKGTLRTELKDALMHGVAASGRVHAAQTHAKTLVEKQQLETEKIALKQQLETFKRQVKIYANFAADMGTDFGEIERDFGVA